MLKNISYLKQSGVSLIEILITTLILGIGLLGVAALQVSSVSSNQEGFFTTQATSIAEDLSSRMRASKIITMLPNYTETSATVTGLYLSAGALTCGNLAGLMCRDNGGTGAADCTLADMAAFDLWEACDVAKKTLPGGQVRILRNTNRITLVVDWDSASARADIGTVTNVNANCSDLTNSAIRNCIIMEIVP